MNGNTTHTENWSRQIQSDLNCKTKSCESLRVKNTVSKDDTDIDNLSQASSTEKRRALPGSIDYIQINLINHDWAYISTRSIIIIWLASTISSSKRWHEQLYHIYLKSSFRGIKQHPARLPPVHLQFNQFRKPIFFQTFQYWGGQGCYIHLIKGEYAIISKSIAVSIHI